MKRLILGVNAEAALTLEELDRSHNGTADSTYWGEGNGCSGARFAGSVEAAWQAAGRPSVMAPGKAWMRARQVSKHFGAVTALDAVDLELRLGEVTALVGDNGAGKSTLVKILSGAHQPSAGELEVDGKPVLLNGPAKARTIGVSTIFQELALVENLTVYENVFLGREVVRSFCGVPILDKRRMRERVEHLIAELGAHLPSLSVPVAALSGGQRQAVAIARVLDLDTKLVIMDEPTAALAVVETRKVLRLIEQLRNKGKAVLLVSHNLGDVFEVADRILVLLRGRKAVELEKENTNPEEVVGWITGALAENRMAG